MIASRVPRPLTFEEYLRVEEGADTKSEFVDGAIYAMTGASIRHVGIATNALVLLARLLKGRPCRPYGSDLRVYVEAANAAMYPDVAVYCGEIRTWKKRRDVATNPTVIVEVLSPSTSAYDRGQKFEAYKLLPSLKDYVLLEQDRPVAELFSRASDDAWVPSMVRGLEASLRVPSLEIDLPLAELYADLPST